jgi:hypothetical protein
LTTNITHQTIIFDVVFTDIISPFGRLLYGLLRQPKWVMPGGWEMVEKLSFGKISGLVALDLQFNIEISIHYK